MGITILLVEFVMLYIWYFCKYVVNTTIERIFLHMVSNPPIPNASILFYTIELKWANCCKFMAWPTFFVLRNSDNANFAVLVEFTVFSLCHIAKGWADVDYSLSNLKEHQTVDVCFYHSIHSAVTDSAFFRSRFISYHMCGNTDRLYGDTTQNDHSAFRYMTVCKSKLWYLMPSHFLLCFSNFQA